MSTPNLADLAPRQHGIVTRQQALRHLSPKALEHRLKDGRLERLRPGVYRLAGAPSTWRQQLLAACWGAGRGAVVSHRSAARLWGVTRVPASRTEVTVPSPRWCRLPGIRVHRTDSLLPHHITFIDGIPVTTLARTLLDLTSVTHPTPLQWIVDEAVRLRPGVLGELASCLDDVAARGRRRIAVVRRLLASRDPEEMPGGSNAELEMVRALRQADLGRLVQQHKVIAGAQVYYLDAAYPFEQVAVEWDGPVHEGPAARTYDSQRDHELRRQGWIVLRFTPARSTAEILASVGEALARRRDVDPTAGDLAALAPL